MSALSPWGSRSATPKPSEARETSEEKDGGIGAQRANDHTVSHINRLSLKSYPPDCPPPKVQWYHAVDIPKRKPGHSELTSSGSKPIQPNKWVPFSVGDSTSIEAAYQKLASQADHTPKPKPGDEGPTSSGNGKVPVNEDYLFDVDVEKRELGPAYWLGPIYSVRRGVWFYAGQYFHTLYW